MATRAVGSVFPTSPGLLLPSCGRAATGGLHGALAMSRTDRRAHRSRARSVRGRRGDSPSAPASAATTSFHPIAPTRIMDTRAGVGTAAAPLAAGETRALQVVGQAGIPADAVAVAVNLTVTEPTASSYVTVWPAGAAMPTASNVNVVAGQTVANMVDRRPRRRRPDRPVQPRRRRPGARRRHRLVHERLHPGRARAGDGHPRRPRRRARSRPVRAASWTSPPPACPPPRRVWSPT